MLCKYIKLASGDDIIAATEDKCDSFKDKEFITIANPVKVGTMNFPRAGMIIETVIFMPWIAVAAVEEMQLPTRNIVLAVDIDEAVANQYQKFVIKSNKKVYEEHTLADMDSIIEDEYEEDDDEELEDDEENNDNDRTKYH